MNGSSKRWLLAYSLFVMIVTSAPYWLGFASAGTEWTFSGFVIGVDDGNSYLAKMLLGSAGDWLFRSPYTTLPQPGVLVFVPYLLLGKLAGGPGLHLQLVGLFHLFRLAAIPLLVYAIDQFAAQFNMSEVWRRWVTILGTLGGGLGWLLLAFGRGQAWGEMPLAFISPESFGFLALYAVPHLAMARALLLLALSNYLQSGGGSGHRWRSGLLALATFLVNPLTGVSLALVVGAHQVVLILARRSTAEWRLAAIRLLLPAAPYVAYLGLAALTDPFLQGWAAQNQVRSPAPAYYLLAYGLLLPWVVVGFRKLADRRPVDLLPAVWVLALPLLAYAPVGIQRRLPEGGWVALAVMAAWGLEQIRAQPIRRSLRLGLVGLAMPATAILLAGGLQVAAAPAEPAFAPADRTLAYRWLAEQAAVGEIALASFRTSNELPAWAHLRVPIGHGPESVGLAGARRSVDQFFQTDNWQERRAIGESLGANWAIFEKLVPALASEAVPQGWQLAGRWGAVAVLRLEAQP